jgi:RNA polymerase sigma-70 factor (ECF subfamily)
MAGDGLATAFATYRAQLLRYLLARGAGEEADDCLQDLWIRVQAASTDMVTDPRACLYRMAHNLMLDRRRTEIRRGRRDTAYDDDVQGGSEADDAPAAERILIARQNLHRVEATLRSLGSDRPYLPPPSH